MLASLQKLSQQIKKDPYLDSMIETSVLAEIPFQGKSFPLLSFSMGSRDPHAPVLFITGGVHGLERIGVQVVWSLLKTTVDRLRWDESLRSDLANLRLAAIPLLNPVGFENGSRCNGNNVDLMRNSPIKTNGEAPFLLGGHRLSRKLPWHQGEVGQLEPENKALFDYFFQQTKTSRCVISVDLHSGFGMKDRIWFPFSYTAEPFDCLAEMSTLTHLFEQTHPYHIYQIEPQSAGYLLNGDMWDYLFIKFREMNPSSPFLPLTLEMGSWTWVRKNPIQMFYRHGFFNPIKDHRLKRTYRRHNLLFNFLMRALRSKDSWLSSDPAMRSKQTQLGMDRWYGR